MTQEVRREVHADGSVTEWVYRDGALFTKRSIPPTEARAMSKRESRARGMQKRQALPRTPPTVPESKRARQRRRRAARAAEAAAAAKRRRQQQFAIARTKEQRLDREMERAMERDG